ncbi:hypothetical protein ACQUQU_13955 [Thalassolituus sp. LLYu03]|uniref:hypothetical protein n=1 Tax=Thalassolituus sp. LLYu03 TaxID=3421656 RepID=UPI003D291814
MRWLKKIGLLLGLVSLVLVAGFFWLLHELPTRPPQTVAAQNHLVADAEPPAGTCLASGIRPAYQVQVSVVTQTADPANTVEMYHSDLTFRLQLQPTGADRLTGMAADIQISEAGQSPVLIDEFPFLARAQGGAHLLFSAYNDLGLMKQHPLAVLAQVIKNLSVGEPGDVYRFAYDGLARNYRYQNEQGNWQRQASVPGALPMSLSAAPTLQPDWQVQLGRDCAPDFMSASEIQPLSLGQQDAQLVFRMQAQRIDPFRDLSGLNLTAASNAALHWTLQTVSSGDTQAIQSVADMWAAFGNFAQTKNVAQLQSAARFLLQQVQPLELAALISNQQLTDAQSRDLLFGLSLLSSAAAEQYLLDVLTALPAGDAAADLAKVRTMVAVTGNGAVSQNAYDTLQQVAADRAETANVRNNALISLGSVVQQMETQGQDVSTLSSRLSQTLLNQMNKGDAASAILAAGNAGLDSLDSAVADTVLARLSSGNSKERYSAALVLSRSADYYDRLISQLEQETSPLVSHAIVSGLEGQTLSQSQRQSLTTLAASRPDLSVQLAQLLD